MILELQTLTRPRLSRHEEKSDQQDFPQTTPVSRAKDQSLRYHKMQARVQRLHRLHQQTAFTSVTQPNDDTDSDVPRVSVNSNPGTHCTNISGNLDIRRSTIRARHQDWSTVRMTKLKKTRPQKSRQNLYILTCANPRLFGPRSFRAWNRNPPDSGWLWRNRFAELSLT